MQHDDDLYVGQILDTGQKILDSVENVVRADYDKDENLRDLLAFRVQIIGEASGRLSAAFRVRYPHIPWTQIIGMRHRIVHDYLNVNSKILWEVCTKNIPELIAELRRVQDT